LYFFEEKKGEVEKYGKCPPYSSMKMVHSRNVAGTWEEKSQTDRWLFDGISVKDGTLFYW